MNESTIKFLEIRDYATRIPVMAVIMRSDDQKAQKVLRSAGFSKNSHLVLLHPLTKEVATYDTYHWADRTFRHAHEYIAKNWDTLKNGDVVDVEYILGESDEPKKSEIQELY